MTDLRHTLKAALFILIITGLLLLLLTRLNTTAIALKPVPGNDRFGLAFISAPDALAGEARYAGAVASGARWNRWPLYWHWVAEGGYSGPHQGGQHDYDTLIAEDIRHGLTPLVILMGTPADEAAPLTAPAAVPADLPLKENPITISEATLPPRSLAAPIFVDGSDEPGHGKAINPANRWATFVFETVERYRPGGHLARQQGWSGQVGVRHWEVWNEPDFDAFWRGSVEEYARLLEVAYKSIKAADPQATVLLGGLAFYEKPGWLPQFLRQATIAEEAHFDVLSVHHYWSLYSSEARLLETRAALDNFGLGAVPIWITESGLSVWDDYPATAHDVSPDTPWRGTMAEQAAYVIQHSALALYHGIERYYHFMLHDDCGDGPSTAFGLRQNFSPHVCNPADGQPRPAYAAYQLAAAQFDGLEPLWRERTAETDQVAFYRPADRSRVLVVWATRGVTVTQRITATGAVARRYWLNPTDRAETRRSDTLSPDNDQYELTLPPATNQNALDPTDTAYHIGGLPFILIERDTLPPTASLAPLPAASPPQFQVTWQGQDRGSGVAAYQIWVSQDGGPLRLWLTETTATQATYSGRLGHRYGFAIRARDRAGNLTPRPLAPQVVTEISDGPTVSGVVLGPTGEAVPGAAVSITGPNSEQTIITNEAGRWPDVLLPGGTYTFQAASPPHTAWPAPRTVTIEPPAFITLTLAPPLNAIASGDFEGERVWQAWTWTGQVNLFYRAFDGEWAARLGQSQGEGLTCADGQPGQQWFIRQPVTVPTDSARLSFLYTIETPQPASAAWFDVALLVNDQPVYLDPPGEMQQPTPWTLTTVDVSAWAGQAATLQFRVVNCEAEPFRVSLDRVSLGSIPE